MGIRSIFWKPSSTRSASAALVIVRPTGFGWVAPPGAGITHRRRNLPSPSRKSWVIPCEKTFGNDWRRSRTDETSAPTAGSKLRRTTEPAGPCPQRRVVGAGLPATESGVGHVGVLDSVGGRQKH